MIHQHEAARCWLVRGSLVTMMVCASLTHLFALIVLLEAKTRKETFKTKPEAIRLSSE